MTNNVRKFPLKKRQLLEQSRRDRFKVKIMLCNSFKLSRKDQRVVDEAEHFYTHNGLNEKQNTIDLHEQRLDMILSQCRKLERLNWFDRISIRLTEWNDKRIERKLEGVLNREEEQE
jgi:hypothetical protein